MYLNLTTSQVAYSMRELGFTLECPLEISVHFYPGDYVETSPPHL